MPFTPGPVQSSQAARSVLARYAAAPSPSIRTTTTRTADDSAPLALGRGPESRTPDRPARFPKDAASCHTVDRKSVVKGKSVSVRVDLGGGRIFKKKKKKN